MALERWKGKLAAAATALAMIFTPAVGQAQDAETASATQQISVIPSPEGLSFVEGIDTAADLSRGTDVFPVTVNIQKEFAGDQDGYEQVIRYQLAENGVDNVWVHFNVNNGDSTSITFWVNEVPHKYNLADMNPDVFSREARLHEAHKLMQFESLGPDNPALTGD